MICPACRGAKEHMVFTCPGFKPKTLPCDTCLGTGQITAFHLDCIEKGKAMRKERVHVRMLSQIEAAKERGVDIWVIRKLEQGDVETWKEYSQ